MLGFGVPESRPSERRPTAWLQRLRALKHYRPCTPQSRVARRHQTPAGFSARDCVAGLPPVPHQQYSPAVGVRSVPMIVVAGAVRRWLPRRASAARTRVSTAAWASVGAATRTGVSATARSCVAGTSGTRISNALLSARDARSKQQRDKGQCPTHLTHFDPPLNNRALFSWPSPLANGAFRSFSALRCVPSRINAAPTFSCCLLELPRPS